MTEQKSSAANWETVWNFTSLFGTFKEAMRPGKMALALAAVILIAGTGWIMDAMNPCDTGVMVDRSGAAMFSEIDAYSTGGRAAAEDLAAKVRSSSLALLVRLMGQDPIGRSDADVRKMAEEGSLNAWIEERYDDSADEAAELIERRYDQRRDDIKTLYAQRIERTGRDADRDNLRSERDAELEQLCRIRNDLRDNLAGIEMQPLKHRQWVALLIVPDPEAPDSFKAEDLTGVNTDRKHLRQALSLAQIRTLAAETKGIGIFQALSGHLIDHFHGGLAALLLSWDIPAALGHAGAMAAGLCWLWQSHWFYAVILTVAVLAILSIFGGAICRMTALSLSRDERIGPSAALGFAGRKFVSLFMAPLIPLAMLGVIAAVIMLGGLLGIIPVVGEWITAVFLGLTLIGGFIFTVVFIGLAGGINLMTPVIAVEGSDSFDAISRSLSYLFARPWRLGLYTIAGGIYGAICYGFVRLFAFVMVSAVHTSLKPGVNFFGAADKLDGFFPAVSFMDLTPQVNWATLGFSSMIAAGIVCLWLALAAAVVAAFVVSYHFTLQTRIYCLMRYAVDHTDMDEVYCDTHYDDVVAEAMDTPDEPQDTQETMAEPMADDNSASDQADQDEPRP